MVLVKSLDGNARSKGKQKTNDVSNNRQSQNTDAPAYDSPGVMAEQDGYDDDEFEDGSDSNLEIN